MSGEDIIRKVTSNPSYGNGDSKDAEDIFDFKDNVLASPYITNQEIYEHQPGHVDCPKRDRFLSKANQLTLLKEMYSRHVRDGGTRTKQFFQDQLPWLMKKWPHLNKMDSYESLVDDPESEIVQINKDFLTDHECTFAAGGDFKTLTPTYKMDVYDYRNLDIRGTGSDDRIVDNGMYRFNNEIPLYQKTGSAGIGRHYDFAGSREGLTGRSVEQDVSGYDMSAIYREVDRPYRAIDTLTEPYYGWVEYSGEGGTSLYDTGWE